MFLVLYPNPQTTSIFYKCSKKGFYQPKARQNKLKHDFTLLYVLSDDSDMLVPVRPCVLVPETHHMTQLMSHNTKLVTVLSNGDCLRAPASATHVGTTPRKENPQNAAHQ